MVLPDANPSPFRFAAIAASSEHKLNRASKFADLSGAKARSSRVLGDGFSECGGEIHHDTAAGSAFKKRRIDGRSREHIDVNEEQKEEATKSQFSQAPRFRTPSRSGKASQAAEREIHAAFHKVEEQSTAALEIPRTETWQAPALKQQAARQSISPIPTPLAPFVEELHHDIQNPTVERDECNIGTSFQDPNTKRQPTSPNRPSSRLRLPPTPVSPPTPPSRRFLMTTSANPPQSKASTPPRRTFRLPASSANTSTSPPSSTRAAVPSPRSPASLLLLNTVFSPHKRSSKHAAVHFVRGGWADCVRGWVVDVAVGGDTGAAGRTDRGGAVVTVSHVSGSSVCSVAPAEGASRTRDPEDASSGLVLLQGHIESSSDMGSGGGNSRGEGSTRMAPVHFVLVGSPSQAHGSSRMAGNDRPPQTLRVGSKVHVGAPTWDLDVHGQIWRVGVDWSVVG